MSKVYPLASQGSRSESPSGELPKQANLRFGDPQRIRDLTSAISSSLASAISALGGLDWAAASLGRKLTYSSKISEALHGVEGRRPTVDLLALVLSQGGDEARAVLALMCDAGGFEAPRPKHIATDAEIVAALRAEIDDTGPAGKALAERVAKRLGVDIGAVRR